MAQRSRVPKFGNWEGEENAPYTAYFDKARKDRSGGKIINPNDPQDNPDAFFNDASPDRGPPFRTSSDPEVPIPVAVAVSKPKHEQHSSKEDEARRSMDSPARHDIGVRRAVNDSPQRFSDRGVNYGDPPRPRRLSGTADRSIDQSPLHPHSQARAANKVGVNSPSWERKGSSEASRGSHTPTRSRLRTAKGDETPEKGAAVPKFGDWDESDPASADSYTHIFNKVREEKQTGAGNVPVMPTESSYYNGQKKDKSRDFEPAKCWCFPLSRK